MLCLHAESRHRLCLCGFMVPAIAPRFPSIALEGNSAASGFALVLVWLR